MADTVKLTAISSRAWEHPADRAALNALRALPGFDEAVRRVMGFLGERGVRQLFLANAVRVGPQQRPKLNQLYSEVLETLDAPERWDLYVAQTPIANAMAVGFQRPFIVFHSGMLEILDEDERRAVLAHEVGHIMSGHPTYTTLAIILLTLGLANIPILAGIALLPFELALLEWYRKSEFSADRAALLGTQDVRKAQSVNLKLAGGPELDDPIDLDSFLAQAREYETMAGPWDKVWQFINTVFRTHPFATVRAGELQRWIDSGEYERILGGEYTRRDQDPPPLANDFRQAGNYYGDRAREAVNVVGEVMARARDAFGQAWRSGSSGSGGTGGASGGSTNGPNGGAGGASANPTE
jgi:Zn-dependent protease with chaperone function